MSAIRLALLWHMHQPVYRLQGQAVCPMPWVRLHAIRSYYDMARLLDEFPDMRLSMNLVPSLVRQIQAYVDGASDEFLEVARRPVEDLDEAEQAFLLEHFFSVDEPMLVALPRYAHLKRARDAARQGGRAVARRELSHADLRDLTALFDLAWFGFAARTDFPEIEELRRRGAAYSSADVERIHAIEREVLGAVLGRYRAAAERGQIEITSSPSCHPILPLLIDSEAAREALPRQPLPAPFRWPADAASQIRDGLDLMERTFGHRPVGMWPSEGSVSQAAAAVLAAGGVRWFASDQDVLARSERSAPPDPYRTWLVETPSGPVRALFRDHELSDRIGFRYATMPAETAAADLVDTAVRRANQSSVAARSVLIALDGENAWGHYPNAGGDFLRALYRAITSRTDVRPATGAELALDGDAGGRITRLHAGSWIHADFGTWIGGPEKNAAWDLLGKTRRLLETARVDGAPALARADVRQALHAAEGSDWFWWLDGQFDTHYRAEFDRLLRAHLRQACDLAGIAGPPEVDRPVRLEAERTTGLVEIVAPRLDGVTVDGYEGDYFEWRGAERFSWQEVDASSVMQTARSPLQAIAFGRSPAGALLVRIDPSDAAHTEDGRPPFAGWTIALGILAQAVTMRLEVSLDDRGDLARLEATPPGARHDVAGLTVRSRKIVEAAIPITALGVTDQAFELRISLAGPGSSHELRAIGFRPIEAETGAGGRA